MAAARSFGTFTFTSNLPVAVIALRGFVNERSEFLMTTLPVAPLAVPTTGTVYFPHFADGGGWTTQVILVNPTHAPIRGSVQFFDSGSETAPAAPKTLTLADGRSGSEFTYAIPPRSATRLRTSNPTGPLDVGSVRAVPDTGQTAPAGVSIFTYQKDGMTVSEAGVPGIHRRCRLPRVCRGARHRRRGPRGAAQRHRRDQYVGCAHDGSARIDGPGRNRYRTHPVAHPSRIGPCAPIHRRILPRPDQPVLGPSQDHLHRAQHRRCRPAPGVQPTRRHCDHDDSAGG